MSELETVTRALERIAAQKLASEMDARQRGQSSWIDGYEAVVREARWALARLGEYDTSAPTDAASL